MFELADLMSFSVEADFSKLLQQKESSNAYSKEIMETINLSFLSKTHFGNLSVALDELRKEIPDFEYGKEIGGYYVRLHMFRGKKLLMDISKTRAITENFIDEKTEPKKLQIENLRELSTDFNFLFGHLLGTLKTVQLPEAKIQISFKKKGQVVSKEKLQSLCDSASQILSHPKTSIMGFEVEYFDELNRRHLLRFSQSDDEYRFRDKLEFKPETLIDLANIFDNCLKLSNETSSRICNW
jgi:hypothetical protein